jgi:hypothetical protein
MTLLDPPEEWDEADWDESTWLQAAAKNPAFDFLAEEEEDIYGLSDGKPLSPD